MRNIVFNTLIVVLGGVWASAWAEDYPTFYSDDPNYTEGFSPDIAFPENPTPCASDDETCIDTYLDPFAAHLDGNMNAQQPPSPVYTWKKDKCALNNVEQCDALEKEWQAWNERASSASLDFVQGPEQSDPLECNNVYDWWGLRYVYKCQDSQ